MSEIRDLPVDDIRFDGYITLNGSSAWTAEKELLYGEAIGERDVELMLAMFEEKKVPVMLVEKDRMYINYIDELVEKAQELTNTPVPAIGTILRADLSVYFVLREKMAEEIVAGLDGCKMTNMESIWGRYHIKKREKWPDPTGRFYRIVGFDRMKSWHLEMEKMIWICSDTQESGSRWAMQRKTARFVRIT